MRQMNMGVIGVGHMGKNHVRNMMEDKHFQVAGIYDLNFACAEKVANQYGIEAYSDMDILLDDVEAVVIAVPSSLHKEVALKAMEHGVHALVEKPIATNIEDAKKINNEFKKKNLKLMVGHIERFNPVFHELHNIVNYKDVVYIEAIRYSPFDNSERITDASVITDLMIHDIDLVCKLMEERTIVSVVGRGERLVTNKTDFATCLINFEGKAHAVINASRIAQNKERVITIHTKDSCYCADLLHKTLSVYEKTNMGIDESLTDRYRQEGVIKKIFVPPIEPLKAELISFYNSIINDDNCEVDGYMGMKALEICEMVSNEIISN